TPQSAVTSAVLSRPTREQTRPEVFPGTGNARASAQLHASHRDDEPVAEAPAWIARGPERVGAACASGRARTQDRRGQGELKQKKGGSALFRRTGCWRGGW